MIHISTKKEIRYLKVISVVFLVISYTFLTRFSEHVL